MTLNNKWFGFFGNTGQQLETPQLIPSLFAWWDAGSGLTVTNGSSTNTIWVDRVQGLIASASSVASSPTVSSSNPIFNNKPTLVFDGSNDFLECTVTSGSWNFLHDGSGCTVIYVVKPRQPAGTGTVYSTINPGGPVNNGLWSNFRGGYLSPASEIYKSGSGVVQSGASSTINTSFEVPLIYDFSYTEGLSPIEWIHRINGTSVNSGNSAAAPGTGAPYSKLNIGAIGNITGVSTNPGKFELAEILFYNRSLSTEEKNTVLNYLRQKYQIGLVGGTGWDSTNILQSAAGAGVTGSNAGFWTAVFARVNAIPSTNQDLYSYLGSPGNGWTIRAQSTGIQAYFGNAAGAAYTATSLLANASLTAGTDILVVAVHASSSVRLYNARAQVGSDVAADGYTKPLAALKNSIGSRPDGLIPATDFTIYGVAGGDGIPSLAQIQALYDAVKATNDIQTIPALTGVIWSVKRQANYTSFPTSLVDYNGVSNATFISGSASGIDLVKTIATNYSW